MSPFITKFIFIETRAGEVSGGRAEGEKAPKINLRLGIRVVRGWLPEREGTAAKGLLLCERLSNSNGESLFVVA